jgi:xanthine/CO dehydrogenase XdhC/CoxF family maturation factor
MKASDLSRLVTAKTERRPIALVTDLGSNQQALFEPGNEAPELKLSSGARDAVARRWPPTNPVRSRSKAAACSCRRACPSPRLVIVGAVHITQALAPMAALAGYEVIVVDPRRAFATAERFPGLTLRHDWPDEALDAIRLDESSARGHAHPRPQARRSGARSRLAVEGVLYRLARQQEDPRGAPAALIRSGISTARRWRASMGRRALPSAPSRRRRSPSPSSRN